MPNLTRDVVTDLAAFDAMSDEWNAAALANADANVFLTWDWLRTWWRHFGEPDPGARLHVVVLRDQDGLVAAAPWYVAEDGVGPLRATVLRPISYDAGDYGGVLVLRRYEEAAAALVDHLAECLRHHVGSAMLPRLVVGSTLLEHLRPALAAHPDVVATEVPLDDACPFADVREGYNLTRHLKKHKVRQRMRRLSEKYTVDFERHTGAQLEAGLERLLAVHQRRWDGRADEFKGLLATPQRTEFLLDAVRALDRRGWLLFTALTADDHVAAVELDFEFAKRVFMFKAAIDPDFAEFSPGQLITYHLFEEGIARGVEEFDFLRGDHPYKRRWATDARHLVTLRLARPGWRGKVDEQRQRAARALETRIRRTGR